MPQTFAIILQNLAIIPQPFATTLTLFSTNEVNNVVNACYTAASVNIQHSLAGSPAVT